MREDRKNIRLENASVPILISDLYLLLKDNTKQLEEEIGGNSAHNCCNRIMECLAQEEGISQLDIVNRIHMKAPTVSLAIKKLEYEKYVERVSNLSDMRSVKVYLTDKGRTFVNTTRNRLKNINDMVLDGMSEEEIKKAREVLIRLRENLLKNRIH